MVQDHPNISLLERLDPSDLASSTELFSEDVVFHYFNSELPDLNGDYVGVAGIRTFFETLGQKTAGTFKVTPVSATAVGDELVVTQTRNTLTLEGEAIAIDVVVVWRFINGRIAEVWDIPSVYTQARA
ncbi:MAG: nuclear transport factor 2 family protein [Pseudomonadota bacterium]